MGPPGLCQLGSQLQDSQVDLCMVVPLEQDTDSAIGQDHDVTVGSGVWKNDPRIWPGFSVVVTHPHHQEIPPFPGWVRKENDPGLFIC